MALEPKEAITTNIKTPPNFFTPTQESYSPPVVTLSSVNEIDGYKKITETELKQILNGSGARFVKNEDDDPVILYTVAISFMSFLTSIYQHITICLHKLLNNYEGAAEAHLRRSESLIQKATLALRNEISWKNKGEAILELSHVIELMETHHIRVIYLYLYEKSSLKQFSLANIYEKRASLLHLETDYITAAELYLKDERMADAAEMYIERAVVFRERERRSDAADSFIKGFELLNDLQINVLRSPPLSYYTHYKNYIESLIEAGRIEEAANAYNDLADAALIAAGMSSEISQRSAKTDFLVKIIPRNQTIIAEDILKKQIDFLNQNGRSDGANGRIGFLAELAARSDRPDIFLPIANGFRDAKESDRPADVIPTDIASDKPTDEETRDTKRGSGRDVRKDKEGNRSRLDVLQSIQ